jgi:hypothetical protein
MKITTMKGKTLDVGAIQAQNENAIALGNASMNARGDIIGPGGAIIRRKEQVAQEYHKQNPNAVKTVSLKDLQPDVFLSPADAVTEAKKDIAAKAAAAAAVAPKSRRIVTDDE